MVNEFREDDWHGPSSLGSVQGLESLAQLEQHFIPALAAARACLAGSPPVCVHLL
jgi:hypothetical protein